MSSDSCVQRYWEAKKLLGCGWVFHVQRFSWKRQILRDYSCFEGFLDRRGSPYFSAKINPKRELYHLEAFFRSGFLDRRFLPRITFFILSNKLLIFPVEELFSPLDELFDFHLKNFLILPSKNFLVFRLEELFGFPLFRLSPLFSAETFSGWRQSTLPLTPRFERN